MVRNWRRRKATMIDVVRTPAGLSAVEPPPVSPTAERSAHGDLHTVMVFDELGRPVMVQRSLSLAERLAQLGELGDDVARLLRAAEWFSEKGALAHLRGRLIQSQLVQLEGFVADAGDGFTGARIELAHVYDVLGADSFNVLYDVLIWDIEPRGADRRALLRAALYALARWLQR
jgi:hypothetical protein